MRVKALKMAVVLPVTVTMRSGHDPSDMFILAPDWNKKVVSLIKLSQIGIETKEINYGFCFFLLTSSLNLLTISPFFPMILPTS